MTATRTKKHISRPVPRTALILIALVAVISLALIFRPRTPLGHIIAMAKSNRPEKDTLTTAFVSTSDGNSKATTVYSTGTNTREALDKVHHKVTSSPDFKDQVYFRLDVVIGAPAANPSALLSSLPAISDQTYFAGFGIPAQQLSLEPSLSEKQIRDLVERNAVYLAGQVQEDGRFVYGREIISGAEVPGYSMNAHAATISALLKAYSLSGNPLLRERAESAIDFLLGFAVKNENAADTAYIENASATYIDLGATALTILALADYRGTTGSTEYDATIRSLANGIESMHAGQDCRLYYHQFALDLTPDASLNQTLYNVQATYALVRVSRILGEESYLTAAARNLDFVKARDYSDSAYWLSLAAKAYDSGVDPDSARYADLVTYAYRSPETIYADFVEPWIAMFSDSPSAILDAFSTTVSPLTAYISTSQSAIYELTDQLPIARLD